MTTNADLLLGWLQPGTACLVTGCNGSGKTQLLFDLNCRGGQFIESLWACEDPWFREQATTAFPNAITEQTLLFDEDFFRDASENLQTGLSYLLGVLTAEPKALLLIDDAFDGLHPHTIRAILSAIMEKAAEKDLRVVLASQNITLLNAFNKDAENVLVFHEGQLRFLVDVPPEPLTQFSPAVGREAFGEGLKSPAWLSHFSLGDLYERGKFGAGLREADSLAQTDLGELYSRCEFGSPLK